jgi:hypothetical protein
MNADDIMRLLDNGAQCNTLGRAAGTATPDVAETAETTDPAAPVGPLDPRQCVAIELMLLGWDSASIAMELKVSRSTVWRWKRDPRFTQLLREAIDRHLGDLASAGSDLIRQAMLVARNTMLNGGEGALRASLVILRSGKAWSAIAQRENERKAGAKG